ALTLIAKSTVINSNICFIVFSFIKVLIYTFNTKNWFLNINCFTIFEQL
ncbi:MAG: hypothetical protein ACI8ZH_000568, partial [Flavobacteriales bacterium]